MYSTYTHGALNIILNKNDIYDHLVITSTIVSHRGTPGDESVVRPQRKRAAVHLAPIVALFKYDKFIALLHVVACKSFNAARLPFEYAQLIRRVHPR
jgi:hypothetical protein